MPEAILEPDLPIVDPHHHLWLIRSKPGVSVHPMIARKPVYLLDEFLEDLNSGHNIRATVFVQCGAMLRADGPEHLKTVGETEFVNGVAAMTASGAYGPVRVAAGIVGGANLTMEEALLDELLQAHVTASPRFRGIRQGAPWDADPAISKLVINKAGLYTSEEFRRGYARLSKYGLSFDAFLLEPQLPDLIDLAKRFPETPLVLDHVGTPLNIGSYLGTQAERFGIWRENIRKLAELPHVHVKLGGLGGDYCHFPSFLSDPPAPSTQLAQEWGPYLEACIEAFGPDRCMLEGNFPVEATSCDYATMWNAFKLVTKGYSADEKAQLYAGTATRFYRLELPVS